MQSAINAYTTKAKLFRGFCDSSRLSILEALRNESLTVGEIVQRTGLAQPNVSNHLGCLRSCGLVSSSQSGRFVIYRLSGGTVEKLLQVADLLVAQCENRIDSCQHYTDEEPS